MLSDLDVDHLTIKQSSQTTMQHYLSTFLLTVTLRNVLSVEPGDPFPGKNQTKVRIRSTATPSSNSINWTDPNDDIPSMTTSTSPPIENTTTTTTTTTPLMMMIESRLISKNGLDLKLLPSFLNIPHVLPDVSISKHNLIRINRWKYEDYSTNEIRYWYEPEDGQMGKGWVFDTVAFLAYSRREPGTKPVFSFHSEMYGEWTNTLQFDPMPPLIGAKQWIPDGISFYTYPLARDSKELQPVWRYWDGLMTNSTDEVTQYRTFLVIQKNGYEQEQPAGWIRDQILFYALPYEL